MIYYKVNEKVKEINKIPLLCKIISFFAIKVFKYTAITLNPYIIMRKYFPVVYRHELIHIIQQRRDGFWFWIRYVAEYIFNLFRYFNFYKAYLNISYEKEAYKLQNQLSKWYTLMCKYNIKWRVK